MTRRADPAGSAPSDLFTAAERGDTLSHRSRLLLRVLALVVLLGATGAVVWGGDALRARVGGPADGSGTSAVAAAADDGSGDEGAMEPEVIALRTEDARLREAVAGAVTPGTVLLTARSTPYGVADLVGVGALVVSGERELTLQRSVVVARGATLDLVAPGTTLRMRSDAEGFTSIVAWDGTLNLAGAEGSPLTVVGWDVAADAPDTTTTDGRSYLRVKDGRLNASYVALRSLGFWSGRTGGLAVTGAPETLARAFVTGLDVADVHIGLYLSGVQDSVVDSTTVVGAQQDGLEITNSSRGIAVQGVTVDGVGGDGISVSRGSSDVDVTSSAVRDAGGYGLLAVGTAMADGPNSAGWSTQNYAGLRVDGLVLTDNVAGGVRVDATDDVRLVDLDVTGSATGVDLRGPSDGTDLVGSTVRSGDQVAVRVRDDATGVRLSTVALTAPTTAALVEGGAEVVVSGADLTVDEGHAVVGQGEATTVQVTGGSATGQGAGAVVARSGGVTEDADVDTDAWRYRPVVVTWAVDNVHAMLLLLLVPVPVVGLLFVLRRRREQRELRLLFQDEMVRSARLRLDEYDAHRAAPDAAREPEVVLVPAAPHGTTPAAPAAPPTPPAPEPPPAASEAPPTPPSTRELAVTAVVEQGYRPSDVARTLRVPTARVRTWVDEHHRAGTG